MAPMLKITSQNFAEATAGKYAAVMFSTTTCPACHTFAPVLEKVGADYAAKGVAIGKALCEDAMDQASTFEIMYVPTTVLFKDGKPVDQFVGGLPEPELRQKLDALLA